MAENIKRLSFSLKQRAKIILLKHQGGSCATCGAKRPRGNTRWVVDHDHKTGEMREVLCHNCNIALGHVHDNKNILKAMIKYLDKWKQNHAAIAQDAHPGDIASSL